MRLILLFVAMGVLKGFCAESNEPKEESPNKHFIVSIEDEHGQHPMTVYLLNRLTHAKETLYEFTADFPDQEFRGVYWSPDSRHVAIEVQVERSSSVFIFSVSGKSASAVEFLPLPPAMDKEPYKIRGDAVENWEGSNRIWIMDMSKLRSFRYHFTKDGKLLADKYEDDVEQGGPVEQGK